MKIIQAVTRFEVMVRIVLFVGLVLPCRDGVALAAQPNAPPETASVPVSLTDYTLTNWSEEQGPFPFGIYAIAQDHDGYLWLGARTGLVRFDGSEFVLWKGRQPLPDERVAAILAARDGSLWVGFGTVGGVAQIVDGTARQFTAKDGLAEGDVNAIVQDPQRHHLGGQPWRTLRVRRPTLAGGGRGRGTATCAGARTVVRFSRPTVGGHGDGSVPTRRRRTHVHLDRSRERRRCGGRSGGHGLGQRPRRGISHRRPPALSATRSRPDVPAPGRGLLIDRSGSLWVGTRGAGLMRVHGDNAGVNPERIEHLTRRQGLLSDEVRALFQDRNGSLWIGSRRGLSRLSESNIRAVLNRGGSDGFVAAVTVTRDGAVWTATATGLRADVGLRSAPIPNATVCLVAS